MLKVIIAASLVGLAAAECPNACSGHGTCSKFDMCTCYSNWQGNDCSQRTCPFDLAHVDTPKGNLNGDEGIDTALVLQGSTVYPQGTYEGFPPNSVESAHYYMECSNKGICDRTTGECACFDGYEGTACQRASCPNDCSGHGTCETIEELSGDVVYKLWDRQATMGCKCDAGYGTADCSERECKYGVDPLYIDDTVGRFTEVQVVTSLGTPATSGKFALVFYDVHGEDYETAPIEHGATCVDVQKALVALPNDVIKCDLAAVVDPDSATQGLILDSCVTCDIDTVTGPPLVTTYTIGFPNNPGYLRPLEVVTNRPGVFSNLAGFSVSVNTVNIGEFVDHFATDCKVTNGATAPGPIDIHSDFFSKLKKCLGDSDGLDNNVEIHNWDKGFNKNPHAIKVVNGNAVQFGFISWPEDPKTLDPGSTLPATSAFTSLSVFSAGGSVFATDAVATYVRKGTFAADTDDVVGTGTKGTYTLSTADDTSCVGSAPVSACLTQGDNIFVFDKTVVGSVQMYTVVRLSTNFNPNGTNAKTYAIEVDYPLAVTGSALKIVRFVPSTKGSYEYVSQCSNRGTCDTSSGLCQCFKGYTGDDCAIQSALAV